MPKPVRSSEGIKELFSAVDRGSLHFVEQSLIQHPDIINERNKYGYTALHLATQKSYLDIVKLLLKYEANPNILGGDIYTALEEAAEKGNLEVVNLLIENGANVEREKIFLPDLDLQSIGLAAKNGHLEVVKALIEKYPDSDKEKKIKETCSIAANAGQFGVVYELFPMLNNISNQDKIDILRPLHRPIYSEVDKQPLQVQVLKLNLALAELQITCKNRTDVLAQYGNEIVTFVNESLTKKFIPEKDFPKLINFIDGTKKLISNPNSQINFSEHVINTQKFFNTPSRFEKLIYGIGSIISGIALMTGVLWKGSIALEEGKKAITVGLKSLTSIRELYTTESALKNSSDLFREKIAEFKKEEPSAPESNPDNTPK